MKYIEIPFKPYVLTENYELANKFDITSNDESVIPGELGITERDVRGYICEYIKKQLDKHNVLQTKIFKEDIKDIVISCRPTIIDFDCLYEYEMGYDVIKGWSSDSINSLLFVRLNMNIDTLIDCIPEDKEEEITECLLVAYKPDKKERAEFLSEEHDNLLYELLDNLPEYVLEEILWDVLNVEHLIDEIDRMLDYKVSILC